MTHRRNFSEFGRGTNEEKNAKIAASILKFVGGDRAQKIP